MKKLGFLVALTMLFQIAFAGGLVTNYNQSAQYVRMLSRNASLDIDAVFYNPAGLVKLQDGWHFSVSSQTIWQDRNITSNFPLLNNPEYKGTTFAPVFPDVYAAYKKGKWAFSLGVGPVGGGGSAKFENGLPSFEIPISKVVPGLAGLQQINPALKISGYSMDMSFDASSIFWGIQLGASYAINDIFSVYGGVRIVPAINTYQGTIENIMLNVGGTYYPAPDWLGGASATVGGLATQMEALANMPGTLSPYLSAAGSYTLAQLEGAQQITPTMRAGIEAGLKLMNLPQAQIDAMNLNQIYGAYVQASPTFQANASQLSATSQSLANVSDQMGNKEVDSKQTGTGFTPMIAVNISPNEDWNIGLKYEMKTALKLTNDTKVDDMGLFPDGGETRNDIPAIFTAGVGYRGLKWLEAQLSYNMYFDKGVEWGNNVRYTAVGETLHREIDKNYYEIGLGLQFNLSDKFAISVGGLSSQTGVAESYQSDFSYSNSSYSVAGGIQWKITDHLTFDAGVLNTFYTEDEVNFSDSAVGNYTDVYNKTTLGLAAGLSYSIF